MGKDDISRLEYLQEAYYPLDSLNMGASICMIVCPSSIIVFESSQDLPAGFILSSV